MSIHRDLDIIVLGATGYTGTLCTEHIVKNLPTNLKWAIAGRSLEKLNNLAAELGKQASDRKSPELFPVQLNDKELGDLVRKTKVLINCVGPYHVYSTPVVKACALNGTHYVDATGEYPWVKEMVSNYHETAKTTGAILISAAGLESAPPDLLSWAMASFIKDRFAVLVKDVTMSIHQIKSSGPSGGTLASVLTTFSDTPLKELVTSTRNPYDLSLSKPVAPKKAPLLQQLLGAHHVPDIGSVTTAITAPCDTVIVHRTSSLMPQLFDKDFQFREYLKVRNSCIGIAVHVGLMIAAIALMFPPVRWIVQKLVYSPGQGPTEGSRVGNRVEYRGVATAQHDRPGGKDRNIRVLGTYSYEGCPYTMTGILLAEAAMVMATSRQIGKDIKEGYLTPAALGLEYVNRLEKVGITIQTKVLES